MQTRNIPPHLIPGYIARLKDEKQRIDGYIADLVRRQEEIQRQRVRRDCVRQVALAAARGASDSEIASMLHGLDAQHGRVCSTDMTDRIALVHRMAKAQQRRARNVEIWRRLYLGEAQADIARDLGVHRSTVCRVAKMPPRSGGR